MHSIDHLEQFDISIPPMPVGQYKHHPLSKGQNPVFYRLQDLKDHGQARTAWVTLFEEYLIGLFWKLGKPVPYAFRIYNGSIRSLDAGCLKFLLNRMPPEISLDFDQEGFIRLGCSKRGIVQPLCIAQE